MNEEAVPVPEDGGGPANVGTGNPGGRRGRKYLHIGVDGYDVPLPLFPGCHKKLLRGVPPLADERGCGPHHVAVREVRLFCMFGGIEFYKWEWRNCQTAYHEQFKGKEKVPTVTLEAICDQSFSIWIVFFGLAGCLNDINVVKESPLAQKIASGEYPPPVDYRIKGVRRNKPYWLCDLIYLKCPVFVETISAAISCKHEMFKTMKELESKDIDRSFRMSRMIWYIIRELRWFFSVRKINMVMKAVIIFQNITV